MFAYGTDNEILFVSLTNRYVLMMIRFDRYVAGCIPVKMPSRIALRRVPTAIPEIFSGWLIYSV
jgi:hypothetical protein